MSRLRDQIIAIQKKYPSLELDEKRPVLRGKLYVDGDDHFFVEINFMPWKRHRFPKVKEIGERIPPTTKRHIFLETRNCCLTTRFKEEILLQKFIKSLDDFFSEVLIPYFLRQIYYELHGRYDSELDHNVSGIIQSYEEELGISDLNLLIPLLEGRLKGVKLGRNDLCYCGNNKLKNCHEQNYNTFRIVSAETLKCDLAWFKERQDQLKLEQNETRQAS